MFEMGREGLEAVVAVGYGGHFGAEEGRGGEERGEGGKGNKKKRREEGGEEAQKRWGLSVIGFPHGWS